MIGVTAISVLLGVLFSYGFLALLFGMGWYYGTTAFGEARIPGWTRMPRAYYRDALFVGVGGTAAWVALVAITKWANQHLPGTQAGAGANFGSNLDALLPSAAMLGSAVRAGLTLTAVVAIAAAFIASMIQPKWLRALLFVLAVLTLAGFGFAANWHDPMDVAKKMVFAAVWIGLTGLAVRYVVRFNTLGYFLIVAGLLLLSGAGDMLRQTDYFYRANGYGVLLALAVLFGWPLVAWRRSEGAKI
jgi:hypothetical protein